MSREIPRMLSRLSRDEYCVSCSLLLVKNFSTPKLALKTIFKCWHDRGWQKRWKVYTTAIYCIVSMYSTGNILHTLRSLFVFTWRVSEARTHSPYAWCSYVASLDGFQTSGFLKAVAHCYLKHHFNHGLIFLYLHHLCVHTDIEALQPSPSPRLQRCGETVNMDEFVAFSHTFWRFVLRFGPLERSGSQSFHESSVHCSIIQSGFHAGDGSDRPRGWRDRCRGEGPRCSVNHMWWIF